MSSSRRIYSEEEKRLVHTQLILNNGDVAQTSQETGINERTIRR